MSSPGRHGRTHDSRRPRCDHRERAPADRRGPSRSAAHLRRRHRGRIVVWSAAFEATARTFSVAARATIEEASVLLVRSIAAEALAQGEPDLGTEGVDVVVPELAPAHHARLADACAVAAPGRLVRAVVA